MNNYCSNITFTSKITPVTLKDFNKISRSVGIDNLAGYPWVLGTSAKGTSVYTKDVLNCSVCLITNGEKALLMHLNPCRSHIDVGSKNLHAILLGSKNVPKSLELFGKFKEMLFSLNIPFSVFKNGKMTTHAAYSAKTDEFFISSESIDYMLNRGLDNAKSIKNAFEKVELNKIDYI